MRNENNRDFVTSVLFSGPREMKQYSAFCQIASFPLRRQSPYTPDNSAPPECANFALTLSGFSTAFRTGRR
ncbi:TPA: hypothetical protein ACIBKF_005322, partial [Salmonella enterica subsp. enterica serovar 6,7:y:-]